MRQRDEEGQRASFNALVADGVYSQEFDHPPSLKAFVERVINDEVVSSDDASLKVLDCGCGTGAWLQFIGALLSERGIGNQLFGFDISDSMVDLATRKLGGLDTDSCVKRGDLLDSESYAFDAAKAGFDVIFVFDAVQQLPPKRQFDACELMVERLAPGGVLLVFDHDKVSAYGRAMGRKKFITRYLGVPLVPKYFCNAKYPPLSLFASRFARSEGLSVSVLSADESPKMALVIRKKSED